MNRLQSIKAFGLLQVDDLGWLIEQAEKVEGYEKSFSNYTNTLNETRNKRDKVKGKLEIALKEIKLRKQYESFLKSVIRSGETLKEEQTFEWFCESMINVTIR